MTLHHRLLAAYLRAENREVLAGLQPPSERPSSAVRERRMALILAAIIIGALASGCATPKRGRFCAEWCEPLDLLAVYSDGTCVCSVGGSLGRLDRESRAKKETNP